MYTFSSPALWDLVSQTTCLQSLCSLAVFTSSLLHFLVPSNNFVLNYLLIFLLSVFSGIIFFAVLSYDKWPIYIFLDFFFFESPLILMALCENSPVSHFLFTTRLPYIWDLLGGQPTIFSSVSLSKPSYHSTFSRSVFHITNPSYCTFDLNSTNVSKSFIPPFLPHATSIQALYIHVRILLTKSTCSNFQTDM